MLASVIFASAEHRRQVGGTSPRRLGPRSIEQDYNPGKKIQKRIIRRIEQYKVVFVALALPVPESWYCDCYHLILLLNKGATTITRLRYFKAELAWSEDDFLNPPAEYRGAPLWCWNTKLQRNRLLRQIDQLAEMGLGGFHIHSRVGLDTPYMGEEFMGHVKASVETAKAKGLLACLYDEDRWPSGAAGGLVVAENPEFKAVHLLLTKRKYGSFNLPPPLQGANGQARRSELGSLIARYDLQRGDDGLATSFKRLDDDQTAGSNTWFAYVEPNPPSEWFNGQTYVDTLEPRAIQKFIEETHEKYYSLLGSDFGTTVPSIFTDEPQFAHKSRLANSESEEDLFLPWTASFAQSFQKEYGYDILDQLPRILWDVQQAPAPQHKGQCAITQGAPSAARYHFHDHVCERFVSAFMDTVAAWCRDKNIALIGHMMHEPTLLSQTKALGEAMRCYRNLDMPGVDMLCDAYEYNTVKQATSVARQNGSCGVMSEIYGVTNWTFDFAGHKGAGDWQAALGITFRVRHLTWVSMAGEAKRDYPACIGYQSPWYKEYKYIEDHFSRLNIALTRGRAVVRVAVIHPIESFWLDYGPMDSSAAKCKFREDMFSSVTSWLLHGLVDFDFVSESLLPQQTSLDSIQPGSPFPVEDSRYDVVVVPNLKTIRRTTLDRLRWFSQNSGTVIFAGDLPSMLDGSAPVNLTLEDNVKHIPLTQYHLLQSLEAYRDIRITSKDNGDTISSMLYQLRQDGAKSFLFMCNTHRKRCFATEIGIKGLWIPTVLDTIIGERNVVPVSRRSNGWTWIEWHFEACGSLLVELSPYANQSTVTGTPQEVFRADWTTVAQVDIDHVELSEPNVLLLDYASFSTDGKAWEPETEILRIDNIIRERLGLPLKGEAYRQPWAVSGREREPKAEIRLRYRFTGAISTCDAQRVVLHIPHFAGPVIVVYLNGKRRGTVALQPDTVELGVLEPGQEFELRIECYGNRENSFGTLHMPDGVSRCTHSLAAPARADFPRRAGETHPPISLCEKSGNAQRILEIITDLRIPTSDVEDQFRVDPVLSVPSTSEGSATGADCTSSPTERQREPCRQTEGVVTSDDAPFFNEFTYSESLYISDLWFNTPLFATSGYQQFCEDGDHT
ncbi:glycoside hydrolase family 2 [Fusarium tjaetaba]|uniref:Glycoside hydrolase family 2 n=1 Tax=Fusarium tjaetaba TaxID=1567544 RepID=A0A8H5VJM8_9HYPO|nr:glycoside hydrolase family 2 [Fusarium tjaetaba]KAF5624678.1 glycoside hydrolase family 2 [Fusarium tjaetaba]